MNQSKQDLKYQATQQLTAKFRPQNNKGYDYCFGLKVDITELLKKVVR